MRFQEFSSRRWGYSDFDVARILDQVADAIEAGRPLGPLFVDLDIRRAVHGYDCQQVDGFLRRVLTECGGLPPAVAEERLAGIGRWERTVVMPFLPGLVVGVTLVGLVAWVVWGGGAATLGHAWSWLSGGGPTGVLVAIWAALAVFAGVSFWAISSAEGERFDRMMGGPYGGFFFWWMLLDAPLLLFSIIMIGVVLGVQSG